ncbi:hypothetical protein SERLA73DRAFT_182287 [Serpula lacrymans var. lacrymans S7.3]|uniref:RING-type domain-containing protein n=2 Tax=Serpula lacrymans var. lacrymans TaxID=341189 RepID=F8PX11_SERL3|nr:uncharacterized protein SERLADRAFT_468862 [Serpula lacrymans var. lacrymans S7.9]EGN99337.1 hypothetical protein SERLA73DRAFT_182287 [Serpula lacrymans var. lacrymans S7.3]EGO24901.1 hypothetical protein SERLADRAFT_468862 [Serpula lacrymans var. lacrymans S7.9]
MISAPFPAPSTSRTLLPRSTSTSRTSSRSSSHHRLKASRIVSPGVTDITAPEVVERLQAGKAHSPDTLTDLGGPSSSTIAGGSAMHRRKRRRVSTGESAVDSETESEDDLDLFHCPSQSPFQGEGPRRREDVTGHPTSSHQAHPSPQPPRQGSVKDELDIDQLPLPSDLISHSISLRQIAAPSSSAATRGNSPRSGEDVDISLESAPYPTDLLPTPSENLMQSLGTLTHESAARIHTNSTVTNPRSIEPLAEETPTKLPPASSSKPISTSSTNAFPSTSAPISAPQVEPLSAYTCPICFSPPTYATLTPCGHICCGPCLFTAVKSTMQRSVNLAMERPVPRCPICRAEIPNWDGHGGGVVGLKMQVVYML